jgi:hypothetical protein
MVYRRRRILLSEVGRQCRFAMIAYSDASKALERRDAERCWYSLQGLIAAAIELRGLLWPAEVASFAWAVELRAALDVTEDSPLNQPQLVSAADPIGALESFILSSDAAAAESVRCFDPETGAFALFGKVVELPPLLTAIAELAQKAERELQHLREVV